ncbi:MULTISPECIES: GntR family transcriptional regulator [unclassified Paenibacillus]|uniref:GntR family transcriptional regulator n=1 Tax=unclassified Paenibacillus TaxID=185978 RepID=UPI001C0FCE61|nr:MULTISPECIES: GntR family transcriptional regulator [unclassified Paenibacillus]MBU5445084.1 GntR family transcriptional regulator [Paenibacillus sp. MSJ-34]CAH0122385.1 HTH-type transcriptional repressor GlaR [Paenibacillus sp. CECT 9249]
MAKRNGSSTLSENVTKKLQSDILAGQYEPGSPLIVSELAKGFDVSVAVVREALTRLATQGLVLQNPNHGFSVKTVSEEELNNIIQARSINESEALRLSIAYGDLTWESNVIAVHHKLSQTAEYKEVNQKLVVSEQWSDIHRQFHYQLIAACPNPVLLDICRRLWDLSEFYRHYSTPQQQIRDGRAEHKALSDAVLDRDSDRAVKLFRAHIQLTADILFDNR